MITVGTGIGGGIVLGGRIYRGATGGAGELGHTIVGLDLARLRSRPDAAFPQPGSLEFVASGHALDRLARAGRRRCTRSRRSAGFRPRASRCSGRMRCRRHATATRRRCRMVEIWGQRVGIGVANAINTFDPEEVVIGGGAARAGDLLLEPAKRVARRYIVPGLGRRTTIRLARHGVRAGVLGAALLAAHELEDSPIELARRWQQEVVA